jgi:hypothetical protein
VSATSIAFWQTFVFGCGVGSTAWGLVITFVERRAKQRQAKAHSNDPPWRVPVEQAEPVSKLGLLPAEQLCMDSINAAHRSFLALPRQHPDELRDWADAIHRMQDAMALRVCRRIYPEGWATYGGNAVSVKAYEEDDLPFEMQRPHEDPRVRQAMGDATSVDDQPS